MKSILRHPYLLLAALLLSGCSILPETVRHDIYQMPPSALAPGQTEEVAHAMRIARPSAAGMLRSTRILVLQAPNTLSAYAGARWQSPVPALWRDHLLDAFHNDGRIRHLSGDADGLRAQYELGGTLRVFHLDLTGDSPRVQISFDARLADTASRRMVAGRRFSASEPVNAEQASEVVAAFGRAGDALARELIDWVVQQMAAGTPAAVRKSENSGD